jgi:hypothetical protein
VDQLGSQVLLNHPDYVISVDPGLKSGVALLASEGPTLIASGEVDVLDVEETLLNYLTLTLDLCDLSEMSNGQRPIVLPVVEKFTINARTVANSQAPWSLEVIGIVRNLMWRERKLDLTMQQPVEAKNLMTNPRLRAVECWHKGGAGHANDAVRHALFALYRHGWRDRRLLIS